MWAEVARSIRPLAGRPPETAPTDAASAEPDTVAIRTEPQSAAPSPPKSAPPPLAPLERRMVRALARGQTRAEATLDLHGLTQAQAHLRLGGFLRGGQAAGLALVLVVTGRGRDDVEGRGVLRRMVPHWLTSPEFRGIVLGVQEAGTRQGGAGALYVRLRRRRV